MNNICTLHHNQSNVYYISKHILQHVVHSFNHLFLQLIHVLLLNDILHHKEH
jgi:hypothetical protein